MIMFKAKSAMIKDKGMMADLSRKVELFIEELTDEQAVELNSLAKGRSVDVIILTPGNLDDIEALINEIRSNTVHSNPDDFDEDF